METCNSLHGLFQEKSIYRRNFRASFPTYYRCPKIRYKLSIGSRPGVGEVVGVLRDKLSKLKVLWQVFWIFWHIVFLKTMNITLFQVFDQQYQHIRTTLRGLGNTNDYLHFCQKYLARDHHSQSLISYRTLRMFLILNFYRLWQKNLRI